MPRKNKNKRYKKSQAVKRVTGHGGYYSRFIRAGSKLGKKRKK